MTPDFIYFDMGNVLVTFDEQRAVRQMAEASGTDPARVREVVYESGLQHRFEAGDASLDEFHETFCRELQCQVEKAALAQAGADMFELNVPIVPLVIHLSAAGYRLGILSNTCLTHWELIKSRYTLLQLYFDPVVLSYEVNAMKPATRIYEHAVEQAGVPAEKIVFMDDRIENVEAAAATGIDAIHYHSPAALADALRQRNVESNY